MKDHAKNSGSPLVRLASFIVDKRSLVFLLTIHRYHFLCILLQLGGGGKRFGGLSARSLRLTPRAGRDGGTVHHLWHCPGHGSQPHAGERSGGSRTARRAGRCSDGAFDDSPSHYARASALYGVAFGYDEKDDRYLDVLEEVKEALSGRDLYVSTALGSTLQETIDSEVSVIMVYVAVIVVAVLVLTSQTYAEVPVILLTFVTAMVLNTGTNFLLGKISFVSNSVTSVLQLALR